MWYMNPSRSKKNKIYSNRIRKYLDQIKWKSELACRKSGTCKYWGRVGGCPSIYRVCINYFTISETYCEKMKQDSPSDISDLTLNCRSSESKRANAVAMICHQRHYSQENGDTSAERKCVL
jgi:hypothetical protein